MMIIVILVLLIPILAIILDSSIARAIAGRIDRRASSEPDRLHSERIAFLEGEVERLSSDLSRLQDESEFVQKLLTGGAPSDAAKLTEPPAEGHSDG
jgi:hypothetical protein